MIQIFINPARVEKVVFVAGSDVEQDFDFAAWQAIRPLVDQIDIRLAQVVRFAQESERTTAA
jgi:citrate lyase gamma subunit